MFSGSTFENLRLKEKMQNAQQELSTNWKSIAEKAKKEVKIVNKKARKVLATEDGGALRHKYVMTANLNSGHKLFKRFQKDWVQIHDDNVYSAKKSETVDKLICTCNKDWDKWNVYLEEFHSNLLALPDVISKVDIAHGRINAIGEQITKLEEMLLEYEDIIEREEMQHQKFELQVKLSELVATKHAEFTLKKSIHDQSDSSASSIDRAVVTPPKKSIDREDSLEKQRTYGDAFLDQMNRYIQYGEVDKPIVGYISQPSAEDDIHIDDADLSTLREFLGPEEISSVMQAQASQNKSTKDEEADSVIDLITPKEDMERPKNGTDSTNKESESLCKEIESPTKKTESPNKENESPNKEIESPNKETESTNKENESPNKEVGSPNTEIESPNKIESPDMEIKSQKDEIASENSDEEFFEANSE